jgi:hypothetical protein
MEEKTMSETMVENANIKAKQKGLILVDWNELSEKQKLLVKRNPKLFYVLIDIKLPKHDLHYKGLPDFKDKKIPTGKDWLEFFNKYGVKNGKTRKH